ncbi:Dolichyl-phosphate-mannose--protein mannosyltransferase 4 [Massospora cicadina]|nr:Dolichyl-phosphate-mannose--protein mannosyltransferase 4 [Massospora cicadina]
MVTQTSPTGDLRHRHPRKLKLEGEVSDARMVSDEIGVDVQVKKAWERKLVLSNRLKLLLLVMGGITRFYNIGQPDEVVFDEVHFGKFTSYYLRREYFFDVHPPLAKLILLLGGYFIGFKGDFDFDTIGAKYADHGVPYIGLRAVSASFGACTVPFAFMILQEAGYSLLPAVLASFFILFDNSLITQSRLILLDSQLIFFATLSVYCYIRFYKCRGCGFTGRWWGWMLATGISLALTLSVKMVGLFTIATVGLAVMWDLWRLLDIRRGLTLREFLRHFYARVVGFLIVPAMVYLSLFWIHFQILTRSGTGDDFMSAEFQTTLQGNNLRALSLPVRYGDNVTLLHKDIKAYLHSHPERYPLRYDDGRISTQGQQVTAYPHNDVNNFWRIHPAGPLDEEGPVKNGDVIRLEHISTSSFLMTHDVASPSMPTMKK